MCAKKEVKDVFLQISQTTNVNGLLMKLIKSKGYDLCFRLCLRVSKNENFGSAFNFQSISAFSSLKSWALMFLPKRSKSKKD